MESQELSKSDRVQPEMGHAGGVVLEMVRVQPDMGHAGGVVPGMVQLVPLTGAALVCVCKPTAVPRP